MGRERRRQLGTEGGLSWNRPPRALAQLAGQLRPPGPEDTFRDFGEKDMVALALEDDGGNGVVGQKRFGGIQGPAGYRNIIYE